MRLVLHFLRTTVSKRWERLLFDCTSSLTKNLASQPPFFHKSCLLKRSPSSSTLSSTSPSTLPPPLKPCSQSLLPLFPLLSNLFLNLSFNSSLSSSTLFSISPSTLTLPLQPCPQPLFRLFSYHGWIKPNTSPSGWAHPWRRPSPQRRRGGGVGRCGLQKHTTKNSKAIGKTRSSFSPKYLVENIGSC